MHIQLSQRSSDRLRPRSGVRFRHTGAYPLWLRPRAGAGPEALAHSRRIKARQEKLFRQAFGKTKRLIVFVNFPENEFCGGIMTIFHFAELSRQLKHIHGCDVLNATFFSERGTCHLRQERFPNQEVIFRLTQVLEIAGNLETLVFHVPEMLMAGFAQGFTWEQRETLKRIPDFQINILNQNLEVFSQPSSWASLWELTSNITQTTAFDRYTRQSVADFFGTQLYRLIGYNGLHKPFERTPFQSKEKLLIYSLDLHPDKEAILRLMQEGLPDFAFQEIKGITFTEFMRLNQRALFSLTFGEGFDGYFTTIHFVGGIGFTVYNQVFFPTPKYLGYRTVYKSYQALAKNIVRDIRFFLENPDAYEETSRSLELLNAEYAYNEALTRDLMEQFYRREPTFVPRNPGPR